MPAGQPRSAAVTEPPEIDASVPNSARIWNYWLGGKDNFPVDREAGDDYRAIYPEIVEVARASRRFLIRAVRYLAGEAHVRQFLDIGTGLPTADNTPEGAQRGAPGSRVAYVDADLHDPERILDAAARTLDLTRPIGLMLLGILGHIDDDAEARSIVKRLLEALPSGSYLTVCDGANIISEAGVEAQRLYNESGAVPYRLRTPDQIAECVEGVELVEPGVVSCPRWRPDATERASGAPAEASCWPAWPSTT